MKPLLGILVICTLTGCRLHDNFTNTMIHEPMHFAEYVAEQTERRRYRKLASEVFVQVCRHKRLPHLDTGRRKKSENPFEQGFKDGFVDHMIAGGRTTPPAIPPREYWNKHHQNIQGKNAAHQWFSGYELGAETARDGGYRDMVTIPTSPYTFHELESLASEEIEVGAPSPVDNAAGRSGSSRVELPTQPEPERQPPPIMEKTVQVTVPKTEPADKTMRLPQVEAPPRLPAATPRTMAPVPLLVVDDKTNTGMPSQPRVDVAEKAAQPIEQAAAAKSSSHDLAAGQETAQPVVSFVKATDQPLRVPRDQGSANVGPQDEVPAAENPTAKVSLARPKALTSAKPGPPAPLPMDYSFTKSASRSPQKLARSTKAKPPRAVRVEVTDPSFADGQAESVAEDAQDRWPAEVPVLKWVQENPTISLPDLKAPRRPGHATARTDYKVRVTSYSVVQVDGSTHSARR